MIITINGTRWFVKQRLLVMPVNEVYRKVTISPENLLDSYCLERAEACFHLKR